MGDDGARQIENPSMRMPEADEMIRLSARDAQAFVLALSASMPVNERLRQTIRRYREAAES
jgi:uncharacterized protein (DUF1778 family)